MSREEKKISISAVIPTCNRKQALLSLLADLSASACPILEVIIVDSGEQVPAKEELAAFRQLDIRYFRSERSVCIQRNEGIRRAQGDFVFLCDDDIQVPSDYLQQLLEHLRTHPEAGAVSGLVLQLEKDKWLSGYPVRSATELLRKYIFQLSIWGTIECPSDNWLSRRLKRYYYKKGNHISKAGWPVITSFEGDYFVSPVYGLGASLVKKDWLLHSPYEEVLDRHGIGDNYGVAMGFPIIGIHILTTASVFHHQLPANRLQQPLQYLRRVLALDYFVRTKQQLRFIKRRWLLWSLTGNFLTALLARDQRMIRSTFKAIRTVLSGNNPYLTAAKKEQRITEPML